MRTDYQGLALQAAERKRAGMAAGAALAGCLLLWMGPSTAGLISKHLGKAPAPAAAQAASSVAFPAAKERAIDRLASVRTGMAASLPASGAHRSLPMSLLDEVGKLAVHVSPAEAAGWKDELHATHDKVRAAQLHLWIGEWELAQNEQPGVGQWHFGQAQEFSTPAEAVYGLAGYDTAISLFYEGAYQQSTEAFRLLLSGKTRLDGFSSRNCALWMRHAGACWGVHIANARLGITEPPRLDPLCGVTSLAACLRALHRPWDKKTVLGAMRVTGEGSNVQDIVDAAGRLGVHARRVTADDRGLMRLPMPCVAYVEHDHFVALVAADKDHVSYLCSDCGAYPGGLRRISWKQWHVMTSGLYVAVTLPGSDQDRWLSSVLAGRRPSIRVASMGIMRHLLPAMETLRGLIVAVPIPVSPGCGAKFQGLKCSKCKIKCPMHRGRPKKKKKKHGTNDPVNLATGEEEYEPDADLTVYNPIGPSVVWQRVYNSLSNFGTDYGLGWSDGYNYYVQPNFGAGNTPNYLVEPNGARTAFIAPSQPTAVNPRVICSVEPGAAMVVEWDYAANNPQGYYTVTFPNRSRFLFRLPTQAFQIPLVQETDRNNNAINFNYSGTYISSISDSNGKTLITVHRTPDNSQVTAIDDCYGRSVYYQEDGIPYAYGPNTYLRSMLTHVSQIVSTNAPTKPDRYAYTYTSLANAEGPAETFPYLQTISVPSPTGTGISTATIQYGQYTLVSDTIDANGIRTHYDYTDPGDTKVTVIDTNGGNFSYTAGFDQNMSETFRTDGAGTVVSSNLYADPSDPYRPSSTSNAFGSGTAAEASQGGVGSFAITGQDRPTPRQWDILQNGAVTASSANAAGWSVSFTTSSPYQGYTVYTFNVAAPAGATVGTNYLVRFSTGTGAQNGPYLSAPFAVVALGSSPGAGTASVPAGGSNTFPSTGTDNPAPPVWDILHNGALIATSDISDNWTVSLLTNGGRASFNVTTPTSADTTGVYEVRYYSVNQQYNSAYGSASFQVTAPGSSRKGVVTSTWDQYGNILTSTSARGITTVYTYDYSHFPLGELVQMQEGNKAPTTFTYYEPSGLPRTFTTPRPGTSNSNQTVAMSFTYDLLGNITSTVRPGNNSTSVIKTTFSYTTDTVLSSDPSYVAGGTYTQPAAIGQPLNMTDNLGHSNHFRYDVRGNRVASVDGVGNETDVSFDLADQPSQTALPATGQTGDSQTTSINNYLYTDGPLMSSTVFDELGGHAGQISFSYGPEDELLSRSGGAEPVSYSYDNLYRVTSVSDGSNNQTTYTYNPTGYLATMHFPGTQQHPQGDMVQFISYNSNGELTEKVDGNNLHTKYHYDDPDGRLTWTEYINSSGLDIHSHYDAYGRPYLMTDGSGAHAYTYDDLGLPLAVSTTYANEQSTPLPTQTITYSYYRDGSRKSMTTPAGVFYYGYDADGRPNSVVDTCGHTSQWTYQNNNWLQSQSLGNGCSVAYQYNPRGMLEDLQNLNPAQVLLSEYGGVPEIEYDASGNKISMAAIVPGVSTASGTTSFQYDSKGELSQEQSTLNNGYTSAFSYDSAFNATTYKNQANITYNEANQNTANTYDWNGNPIQYGNNQVSWDPENRMTAFGTLLSAGYRGDGLRAWKQTPGSPKTWFVYDGATPVVEMNSQGQVTAVNAFGPSGLVSRTSCVNGVPSSTIFYTFDTQGSVSQRLDKNGSVLSSSAFDAFGNKLTTDVETDPWGYRARMGYYTDVETGLLLLTHRYYDPRQGRFLNRDPLGYAGGINLYAYTGSNPINLSDPTGLWAGLSPSPFEPVDPNSPIADPFPDTPPTSPPTSPANGTAAGAGAEAPGLAAGGGALIGVTIYALTDLGTYAYTGQTGLFTGWGVSIGNYFYPVGDGLPADLQTLLIIYAAKHHLRPHCSIMGIWGMMGPDGGYGIVTTPTGGSDGPNDNSDPGEQNTPQPDPSAGGAQKRPPGGGVRDCPKPDINSPDWFPVSMVGINGNITLFGSLIGWGSGTQNSRNPSGVSGTQTALARLESLKNMDPATLKEYFRTNGITETIARNWYELYKCNFEENPPTYDANGSYTKGNNSAEGRMDLMKWIMDFLAANL